MSDQEPGAALKPSLKSIHVTAYLRDQGEDPAEAQALFEHWGKYRFLGYKLKRMVDRDNSVGD